MASEQTLELGFKATRMLLLNQARALGEVLRPSLLDSIQITGIFLLLPTQLSHMDNLLKRSVAKTEVQEHPGMKSPRTTVALAVGLVK